MVLMCGRRTEISTGLMARGDKAAPHHTPLTATAGMTPSEATERSWVNWDLESYSHLVQGQDRPSPPPRQVLAFEAGLTNEQYNSSTS